MKAAKRWGTALALLIVIGAVMSGCGNNDNGNSKASPSGIASEQPASSQASGDNGASSPDISKFRKLKVYTVGGFPQPDSKAVVDEINKYLKEKINAEIDFQGLPWSSWSEKMALAYQSGEQVDLTFAPSWGDFANNVTKGAFLP
ncbi:MAG: sugar ABC transporter substrate-binding protein, partial [Cohnella sp.]|nr:sugar ABC transporter substrate-binding protein [Cohnella sp.]